jgi:peptide methionine sulfoxide reductase MsrB
MRMVTAPRSNVLHVGAHLGHVFLKERVLHPKTHVIVVNSISMEVHTHEK